MIEHDLIWQVAYANQLMVSKLYDQKYIRTRSKLAKNTCFWESDFIAYCTDVYDCSSTRSFVIRVLFYSCMRVSNTASWKANHTRTCYTRTCYTHMLHTHMLRTCYTHAHVTHSHMLLTCTCYTHPHVTHTHMLLTRTCYMHAHVTHAHVAHTHMLHTHMLLTCTCYTHAHVTQTRTWCNTQTYTHARTRVHTERSKEKPWLSVI